jgi:cell division protein FtsW
MNRFLSRANKTVLSQWWWTVDKQMLIALLALVVFGVMMVSAASPAVALRIGLDQYHFVIRHVVMLVPAIGFMVGLSFLPKIMIRRIGIVLFGLAILGVVLSLTGGSEIKGAQRWIRILGFSIQPSEFLKPAFIIVAAWLMGHQKHAENFPGNLLSGALFGLSILLLILQPDMGMTILLSAIWASQIFLAGFPFLFIILAMIMGVCGLFSAYFFLPHFQSRVNRFLNPDSGDTYQIDRATEAFGHGGLFGVGPGEGSVKETIPDAHADFVFAVAGEEMGFVFLFILILLYGFIIYRGILALQRSNDIFVVLAIGGLITMFGLQAFIHMGANIHILPTKGMTLPFISYGGSSVIALGIAMGMLLGLSRKQN